MPNSDRKHMRWFWFIVASTAVALGILLYAVNLSGERTKEGQVALASLCTFKEDLERRVRVGEQFLKEHPQGTKDFSVKFINNSLDNQKSTLKSLSDAGLDAYC